MTKDHLGFRGLVILPYLIIFLVKHVPRSATGKIEMPKLREMYGKGNG